MLHSAFEKPAYVMFRPWPRAKASYNLALEEFLFDLAISEDFNFVCFYENEPAVVIGKNQNPWREASLAALKEGFPPLVRRISGGGAVYHGPGNLNVAFILPKEGFSKEENLDLVRRGLADLGLATERTPRGDILLGGKKISGNALSYRRNRVLHHLTLLVDADLEALRGSLSRDGNGVETKAVVSVPSGVANLADAKDGLTSQAVAEAVRVAVGEAWGPWVERPVGHFLTRSAYSEFLELERRYDSWEWTFGATPSFLWRPPASGSPVLTVEQGRVVRAEGSKAERLVGRAFGPEVIEEAKEEA